MSKSKLLPKVFLVAYLLATFSISSFASDSDRITQLEKEVQELKIRLTNLESPSNKPQTSQRYSNLSDGWKNIANWRMLKKGMSYDDVRGTLGEPIRIDGGNFTYWTYSNRGSVTFYNDRLDSWTEPR